jgi:glycosyltransferase involved in cell wall biosynthesis
MMEDVASVSVVIPCFRCAETIDRAVASVASQTLKPAEVILIDDASGDGTLTVLNQLAQQYVGWIKVVSLNENQGAASARNAGWAVAQQPYIAFLDADDTWHADKLHIQYAYMRDNQNVAISGHQCIWLRDGEAAPVISTTPLITQISANNLLFKNCFSTPAVMLKRDVLFRFSEAKRFAEDLYLWQQNAFAGLLIVRLEVPLAYIHKAPYGEGGLSGNLWQMEKGELDNYVQLHRAKRIGWVMFWIASVFSWVKFGRRLLLSAVRS